MNIYRWASVITFFILLITAVGYLVNRTPYDELKENRYYAFVLPEDVIQAQGWQLKPIKHDWDAHCYGGPSAPWNPLTIVYEDEVEQPQLSITISSRDVIWDRQHPIEKVEVDLVWAKETTAIAYEGDVFSSVKFEDSFGNEVVIESWLAIADKVELINKLEYVGPSVNEVISPWGSSWCDRR
jgi:hypothetical protein